MYSCVIKKKKKDWICHSVSLSPTSNQSDTSSVRPLNCWARLVGLYTCPQVKFYWNILFYFGFLFLYALVLITDFQPTPSWKELLLYVWLASLMFEEVRQVRETQLIQSNDAYTCLSIINKILSVNPSCFAKCLTLVLYSYICLSAI